MTVESLGPSHTASVDSLFEDVIVSWFPEEGRPTLGGFLTTLAEGFALCDAFGHNHFEVIYPSESLDVDGRRWVRSILDGVAGVEVRPTALKSIHAFSTAGKLGGPRKSVPYDTSVLLWCTKHWQVKPRLAWAAGPIRNAEALRSRLSEPSIAVHLKHVPPFLSSDSNANGRVWFEALAAISSEANVGFTFVGSDPLPPGFKAELCAQWLNLNDVPVVDQLALVSTSPCYLGMASGLASAAMFSPTPLVIFKHQLHHPVKMDLEFGTATEVPLWYDHQWLIRREPTVSAIVEWWKQVWTR